MLSVLKNPKPSRQRPRVEFPSKLVTSGKRYNSHVFQHHWIDSRSITSFDSSFSCWICYYLIESRVSRAWIYILSLFFGFFLLETRVWFWDLWENLWEFIHSVLFDVFNLLNCLEGVRYCCFCYVDFGLVYRWQRNWCNFSRRPSMLLSLWPSMDASTISSWWRRTNNTLWSRPLLRNAKSFQSSSSTPGLQGQPSVFLEND